MDIGKIIKVGDRVVISIPQFQPQPAKPVKEPAKEPVKEPGPAKVPA